MCALTPVGALHHLTTAAVCILFAPLVATVFNTMFSSHSHICMCVCVCVDWCGAAMLHCCSHFLRIALSFLLHRLVIFDVLRSNLMANIGLVFPAALIATEQFKKVIYLWMIMVVQMCVYTYIHSYLSVCVFDFEF